MKSRDARSDAPDRGGPRGPIARRLSVAAAVATLAVTVLAGLATAQGPVEDAQQDVQDPGGSSPDGQQTPADTRYSPRPQNTEEAAAVGWRQVGGAVFPGKADDAERRMNYVDTGEIPHEVDFFTVAFDDIPENGFAAGAACKDSAPDGLSADELTEFLATCKRVPVIYGFAKPAPEDPPRWTEVYRGSEQGFVGALAWLPEANKAVAVGGNGCYPRREVDCTAANERPAGAGDHIAGDGRAWLFDGGEWSPISDVPEGMTGMTGLDFSVRPSDCGAGATECGFAGGKGQVWMWRDGSFRSPASYQFEPGGSAFPSCPNSDDSLRDPKCHQASPFRVRGLEFAPGEAGDIKAVAVTSGCCLHPDDDPLANFPRALLFGDFPGRNLVNTWTSGGLFSRAASDSAVTTSPRRGTVPDSLYALEFTSSFANRGSVSAISTPGRTQDSVEPGSRVIGPIPVIDAAPNASGLPGEVLADYILGPVGGSGANSNLGVELVWPQLSSVRLVAADGDLESAANGVVDQLLGGAESNEPDGLLDWAVGELRSTGEAVAFTTVGQPRGARIPYPLDCPEDGVRNTSPECQANPGAPDELRSGSLFTLPSFPLNGFTRLSTGVGWAVGDRGALLTLGGSGADAAREANPPKLGGSRTTRLSNREAYDPFRPLLSTEPGLVPPLAARPETTLPAGPRLVAAGSPGPQPGARVRAIAMSRDGSEGWAVGPGAEPMHFNGVGWTRCDPFGTPGRAADPVCESLAELDEIYTIAAVPSDDFEVVGFARHPERGNVVLRYDGGWSIDEDWTEQLSSVSGTTLELAFSAPDDAWLVTDNKALWRLSPDEELSGDEGRWVQCGDPNFGTTCRDRQNLIPINEQTSPTGADNDNGSFASGLHVTSLGSRVYLYGTRTVGAQFSVQALGTSSPGAPVILSLDSDAEDPEWAAELDPKNGEADPETGERTPRPNELGKLNSLSLAVGPDGVSGWGLGDFWDAANDGRPVSNEGHSPLIEFDDEAEPKWQVVADPGPAATEYLLPTLLEESLGGRKPTGRIVALARPDGSRSAVAIPQIDDAIPAVWLNPDGRNPDSRNPDAGRWEVFPASFSSGGAIGALTSDNRGGLWLAARPGDPRSDQAAWFYHYTDRVRPPVFEDVPHPVRETISASAAGGDGSFWVATTSGTVYRYDRLTGWERAAVRGWDSGAVQSAARAIAVGPDGEGLVVGRQGRIAAVGPAGIALDPAAALCSTNPERCGGGRTLRAVAVAQDGSALMGGDERVLLWRPAGGAIGQIAPPRTSPSARITGISMPRPGQAWLATDAGEVFAGSLSGDGWQWTRENVDAGGRLVTRDARGRGRALRAIAIKASGNGYAVGDDGMILERDGGAQPWRLLPAEYGDDLQTVALGPDGRGALIGGERGLVLTLIDGRFELARANDHFDPLATRAHAGGAGGVVGVALLPGHEPSDVEAWAATQVSSAQGASGAILHYTSNPSDPLLAAGAGRAQPLPDTPPRQEGEISIAAFGKSDCQIATGNRLCPEFTGSNLANEVTARAVRDALLTGPGRPDLAVFTGDVNGAAGHDNSSYVDGPTDPSRIHERWEELIAGPLTRGDGHLRGGIPLYGALGGNDLSNTQACDALHQQCVRTHQSRTGTNFAWRQAFAGAPAPWGTKDPIPANGLSFHPVGGNATDPEVPLSGTPLAGARTHYAVDVKRGETPLLRLVVVDTSLKTLSGTAGTQNPAQDQLRWLERVLSDPNRPERAVVVSETPSYTYGSAGAATDTLTDSAAFEALMVRNRVSAVVSGRLGWNGLYWLLAPGLHAPCPGGSYQEKRPTDPAALCQGGGSGDALGQADEAAGTVAEALEPLNAEEVPLPSDVVSDLAGELPSAIPFAVAASAGGKFGPDGRASGSGPQGFWRGYTLIRLLPGAEPVIEQRPVFDWVGLRGDDHAVLPGRRLTLRAFGREPVGVDQPIRYTDIAGPAITHRLDLVLADPEKPYLPLVDPTSSNATTHGYVKLDPSIGQVSEDPDRGTTTIRAGRDGNHPPIFALAILSVGDKTATWPIVFMPRPSFRPQLPSAPLRQVVPLPPPRVVASTAASLPPVPPAQIPNPPQLDLQLPQPPALPSFPSGSTEVQTPVPPPPPPPPVAPAATASQFSATPTGLNLAPQATVIPPPAPPIQPAPPSGARREARQRQAAAAKSEEGAPNEEAADTQDGKAPAAGGNGQSQASTRLDPGARHAFTALEQREQVSAWSRELLYGGGLTLAALTLALGWGIMRPRQRRREPEVPVPAWARSRDPYG